MRSGSIRRAFACAFPKTLPICAGYWFLGLGYGVFATGLGLGPLFPVAMAAFVFSGSVEFVLATMLLGEFHPLSVAVIAFVIAARHLFYGVSMLEKYAGTGWKKPLLIYTMSDETFAVQYSAEVPPNVDRGWAYLFIGVLDWVYWLTGVMAGCTLGHFLGEPIAGLDFLMTAMFLAIFTDQWRRERNHVSSLLGLALPAAAVWLFGPDRFILPAMAAILGALVLLRGRLEKEVLA